MHLTENQIALDAQEATFRPGVQMFDHPFLVTISPERLASSIELAPVAYRDAFALAWGAKGISDAALPQELADLRDEVHTLRAELSNVERLRTNERALLCEEIAARQRAEGTLSRVEAERDGLRAELDATKTAICQFIVPRGDTPHFAERLRNVKRVAGIEDEPTTTEGEKP